jgi:hypothetical protein
MILGFVCEVALCSDRNDCYVRICEYDEYAMVICMMLGYLRRSLMGLGLLEVGGVLATKTSVSTAFVCQAF